MNNNQNITPCLWFSNNAEEAVNFYLSVFPESSIITISRYGKNAPLPEGTALTIIFILRGQKFMALNGGPAFTFNEAISLVIDCETQDEIDMYWEKLTEGGSENRCGWLKDKYGLSWQVVPKQLSALMSSNDKEKSARVMQAFMQMKKFDIAKLQEA